MIEQELFDWNGWDGDEECMIFYDAVLKVQIGKFPIGTKFACAVINHAESGSVLQFEDRGEVNEHGDAPSILRGEYKLHYRVGDVISEKE